MHSTLLEKNGGEKIKLRDILGHIETIPSLGAGILSSWWTEAASTNSLNISGFGVVYPVLCDIFPGAARAEGSVNFPVTITRYHQ